MPNSVDSVPGPSKDELGKLRARDIDLIFEVGTLRHVARTWKQFGGVPVANTAEHSFRVAWIALLLGSQEGADLGRVAMLAILHDLAESRTGDVNYLTRMYTARDTNRAIDDISERTTLQDDLRRLWKEYELGESIEAKVVSDADSLDCDFEIGELTAQGSKFSDIFSLARLSASKKLHTASGRALLAALVEADPHRWHKQADNRTNAGDWADS